MKLESAIFDLNVPPILAYRIIIGTYAPGGYWEYFMDAKNGKLLKRYNISRIMN